MNLTKLILSFLICLCPAFANAGFSHDKNFLSSRNRKVVDFKNHLGDSFAVIFIIGAPQAFYFK